MCLIGTCGTGSDPLCCELFFPLSTVPKEKARFLPKPSVAMLDKEKYGFEILFNSWHASFIKRIGMHFQFLDIGLACDKKKNLDIFGSGTMGQHSKRMCLVKNVLVNFSYSRG